jgi:hypothetical protein
MNDYSAFIPHVVREDLLLNAVMSAWSFGKMDEWSIVDNSPDGLTPAFRARCHLDVLRPTVPLSCSQTFNYIMRLTRERGQKICIWMHSDAEAGNGIAEAFLEYARRVTECGRKWGVLWTYYDTLCAYNTDLLDVIGEFDTTLPQYFCENDWQCRVKLAGYECIDTGLTDVKHVGSATINSDPMRRMHNSVTFPLYHQYYLAKWGGDPGHEIYTRPFNI